MSVVLVIFLLFLRLRLRFQFYKKNKRLNIIKLRNAAIIRKYLFISFCSILFFFMLPSPPQIYFAMYKLIIILSYHSIYFLSRRCAEKESQHRTMLTFQSFIHYRTHPALKSFSCSSYCTPLRLRLEPSTILNISIPSITLSKKAVISAYDRRTVR